MKPPSYAPVYMASVYPRWAEIGREHGYALAVHGSCARDLDVVFVPWAEICSSPADVIDTIKAEFAVTVVGSLEEKAHGRLCQTIAWMGELFADVSFMPPNHPTQSEEP